MSGSRSGAVVTEDHVSNARRPDCEDRDSGFETLQQAIQSSAKAVGILESLRHVLALARPVEEKINLFEMVREFEIYLIKTALEYTGGQQRKAAALLDLKPTTLHMKLKTYGFIKDPRKRSVSD